MLNLLTGILTLTLEMLLRTTLILCATLFFYHTLSAQTCTSTTNGYWQTNSGIWDCGNYPNGSWSGGTHIIIDSDVTLKGSGNPKVIDLSSSGIQQILIKANRKLIFENNTKLILPKDAKIVFEKDAQIVGPSNNSNTLIEIGGNELWGKCTDCSSGPLTGPGTMDETSTPEQPLPITLLFFKGKVLESRIQLEWTTASEKNFDYFSIERSPDAQSFTSIAEVKGQGNSNVPVNYEYTDNKPLFGLNYYRLKSIDFDGYTEYFKVIAVYITPSKHAMKVYPNPVQGEKMFININAESGDHVEMLLQDLSGKTLFQQKLNKPWNEILLKPMIDIGTYILVVKSPKINHSQLLIIK